MNVHPCSITDANTMYFPASSITAFANLAVYVEHSLDICPTVSASRSVPGLLSRPCACSNCGLVPLLGLVEVDLEVGSWAVRALASHPRATPSRRHIVEQTSGTRLVSSTAFAKVEVSSPAS